MSLVNIKYVNKLYKRNKSRLRHEHPEMFRP
jgi:hypothetical protein